MKFTKRAKELILTANRISDDNGYNYIHPIHLFLAALDMNYEKNKELISHISVGKQVLLERMDIYKITKNVEDRILFEIDDQSVNISSTTEYLIDSAIARAQLYEEHGQLYIDDGMLILAIMSSDKDEIIKCLEGIDKEIVISVMSSPRDMIVDLSQNFIIDELDGIVIRKVNQSDKDIVNEFVLTYFYDRWAKTIQNGFEKDGLPVYIALKGEKIIGFAGYNISKNREKYFGPLGVLKEYRSLDVGKALVKSCMKDMKSLGYKNCIIGNGSTIEFYKKACNAQYLSFGTTFE